MILMNILDYHELPSILLGFGIGCLFCAFIIFFVTKIHLDDKTE